ncbi:MAG: type I-U CRISPR-associated protein Cas5/Cas6 [Alicyclobacillus macrosporangiidus]|uniref:type I-G CRISPR-associated protein Csb2 n=1 Tax=Alicyclobacillus macrosporangiidus TaxID=392015 RepID=UPI0026EADBA6|nr:type I-U CRISPR-associated protein Csb2 [Alicyclobacillus macrosporangiidus]MCL6598693.1 type I-U CRISPR-associated protein Cas5/Cas6 [Alicyclobacillus macrosporangiidus]
MIGLEFHFPAGTYHATPWGRYVNQADVEWPPSPLRLLRSLVEAWHRYHLAHEYPETLLRETVLLLATEAPVYALPSALHAHSRHYMPVQGGSTTPVFDTFLRVTQDAVLGVYWPSLSTTEEQFHLLSAIAHVLGDLGRAESWVQVRVVREPTQQINCGPVAGSKVTEVLMATQEGEPIQILAPVPPQLYAERILTVPHDVPNGGVGRRRGAAAPTLPRDLYEAIHVDTGTLHAGKRNLPAGARWAVYYRPALDRTVSPNSPRAGKGWLAEVNVARLALTSRVKPRLEDALDVTEVLHLALVDKYGEGAPLLVTGREKDGSVSERGHEHLFLLPEDADGDGRIDHVVLYAPVPFSREVVRAIGQIRRLYTPSWWPGPSREWSVYLEGMFSSSSVPDDMTPLMGVSQVWVSVTPYLHPWHSKRNGRFGAKEQITKELRLRGLPEPVRIEAIEAVEIRGTLVRPHRFRRLRHTKRQYLPDMRGSFWRLEFDTPVSGPIALGSNCHFGMGLFKPVQLQAAGRDTES